MERLKSAWKRLPDKPRRVVTFIVGLLLILVSGLIGWLPGPGGMVPFLLGIAVLATEFTWAERFRDWLLQLIRQTVDAINARPFLRAVVIIGTLGFFVLFLYLLTSYIH